MKKILFPAACIFLLSSCKSQNSNKELMDIVTVTDNGITYADTIVTGDRYKKLIPKDTAGYTMVGIPSSFMAGTDKNGNFINCGCTIHKTATSALLTMAYHMPAPSPTFPIKMMIANAVGPAKGIGMFKSSASNTPNTTDISTELSANLVGSSFVETFKGGQEYKVDSVTVNVTKASGTTIEGDYKMWLTNSAGSKTVIGAISWQTAAVN